MPRTVRALVSCQDRLLGAVPAFAVESPWWPDTEPVTAHLDALLGTPTTVLRLVSVRDGESAAGGEVTYHAEVATPPAFAFEPFDADGLFDPHPLRAPYARPGGVAEITAWADGALAGQGMRRTGPVTQVKTWNLSCVLRLRTDAGTVWCKSTRDFETPEHAAIELVAAHDPALVPRVLAHRTRDTLFADVPGEDCWDADAATVEHTLRRWVAVQDALAGEPLPGMRALLPAGLPGRLAGVLARLGPVERAGVEELLAGLPDRLAALDRCGLPATLVHGDFHSGNWRAGPAGVTLMDWSDAFVGHPANDLVRLIGWAPAIAPGLHDAAVSAWCDAWRARRPGCDPRPAIDLVRPLVFLEAAYFYQVFLDGIEPSERRYHLDDPAEMVRLALTAPGSP